MSVGYYLIPAIEGSGSPSVGPMEGGLLHSEAFEERQSFFSGVNRSAPVRTSRSLFGNMDPQSTSIAIILNTGNSF